MGQFQIKILQFYSILFVFFAQYADAWERRDLIVEYTLSRTSALSWAHDSAVVEDLQDVVLSLQKIFRKPQKYLSNSQSLLDELHASHLPLEKIDDFVTVQKTFLDSVQEYFPKTPKLYFNDLETRGILTFQLAVASYKSGHIYWGTRFLGWSIACLIESHYPLHEIRKTKKIKMMNSELLLASTYYSDWIADGLAEAQKSYDPHAQLIRSSLSKISESQHSNLNLAALFQNSRKNSQNQQEELILFFQKNKSLWLQKKSELDLLMHPNSSSIATWSDKNKISRSEFLKFLNHSQKNFQKLGLHIRIFLELWKKELSR